MLLGDVSGTPFTDPRNPTDKGFLAGLARFVIVLIVSLGLPLRPHPPCLASGFSLCDWELVKLKGRGCSVSLIADYNLNCAISTCDNAFRFKMWSFDLVSRACWIYGW